MQTLLFSALTSLVIFANPAQASLKGSISFSESEIRLHQAGLPKIMDVASACLQKDLDDHVSFYRQWGVSPFYGDQSSFAKANKEGRRNYLAKLRFDTRQIDFLLKTLQPTSCIGLTIKCMRQGFAAAGQAQIFAKVKAFTDLNGVTGNAMQYALQQLGWKILYWNPDVSKNAQWDAQERRLFPSNPKYIWGEHEARWRTVSRLKKYLYNKVDDATTLVNFGKTTPGVMRSVPFFVGIAHGGYHVFPGSNGQIIEAHSTRRLNDSQTVETSPFNPLTDGGGPRGQYYSGLIAVPPGYIR